MDRPNFIPHSVMAGGLLGKELRDVIKMIDYLINIKREDMSTSTLGVGLI